jgi:hypothetical protein
VSAGRLLRSARAARHSLRCRAGGAHRSVGRALASLLAVWMTVSPLGAWALDIGGSEYRLKAHFLANFANFVEWPQDAYPSDATKFVVGVYGDFRFGTSLALAVQKVSAHGRQIELRWIRKDKELRECQILFISQSEEKRYGQILDSLRGSSILTVGESPSFLDAGGAVYVYPENSSLRFEVNLAAAEGAHLKISSRLLALAKRIINKHESASS